MKESFAQTEEEPTTTTALAKRPPAQPPAAQSGNLIGEFSKTDLQWPRLNLVGKNSELVNEGKRPGSFVLDRGAEVGDGKSPMRIVVLSIQKEYWQKLPQGAQERPMVFQRLDDVHDVGGSVNQNDKDSVPFQECGRCLVLVESTSEEPSFIFEASGKFYAPAVWFLSGTAYGAAGRKFVTDATITLRKVGGLQTRFYEITSKITSNSKGSWFLPVVRLTTDEVPKDLIEQVTSLFQS